VQPNEAKRKVASAVLARQARTLFDSWFHARDDLVLMSAGHCQFVDWVVQKVLGLSRTQLADWYVLRACHVRARVQQEGEQP
jgi:hypothetical protein